MWTYDGSSGMSGFITDQPSLRIPISCCKYSSISRLIRCNLQKTEKENFHLHWYWRKKLLNLMSDFGDKNFATYHIYSEGTKFVSQIISVFLFIIHEHVMQACSTSPTLLPPGQFAWLRRANWRFPKTFRHMVTLGKRNGFSFESNNIWKKNLFQ